MKIVIDENMPYAEALFSQVGEVKTVPGRPLPDEALADADALMVRSVTKVNRDLLSNRKVKFVGTATAGTDHVDTMYLAEAGIAFSAAPGCNAIAVVEYVFSALLALAEKQGFSLQSRTVGIVGVGNVGGRLQARLAAWGVRTLLCDPPRADRGETGPFVDFETVVQQADIISFHTPLYRDGAYKTYHLADSHLISRLQPGTILINACRGEVVDNHALRCCLEQGQQLTTVLDVWEPEPDLDPALLARVDIATAHIAGYTLEGKARGTTQVFEALMDFIGQPQQVDLGTLLAPAEIMSVTLRGALNQASFKRLVHLVYDVRADDALLRGAAAQPGGFDRLRKSYAERREWSALQVICSDVDTCKLLQSLGFSAVHAAL